MAEAAVAPAAPAAPPPASPPAEVVTDSQKTPAESAPATPPEGAQPEKTTDDQEKRSGSRRFERRISQAIRRAAEARAEADQLRKQLEELRKPQQPVDSGAPRIQDFDDAEKYAEAREKYARENERKRLETEQRTKAQREEFERLTSSWEERSTRGAEKYEDWDEIVGEMKPNSAMALAIMEEDNGDDIAYHLGKNLKEAERIAALPPRAQIREIGKLSVKLAAAPPKPKTPSKAPAPISPVSGTKAAEATEVKDGMDYKDFVKVRNRQLGRGK